MPVKGICIGDDLDFSAMIAFCKGPLGEEIEFFQSQWRNKAAEISAARFFVPLIVSERPLTKKRLHSL